MKVKLTILKLDDFKKCIMKEAFLYKKSKKKTTRTTKNAASAYHSHYPYRTDMWALIFIFANSYINMRSFRYEMLKMSFIFYFVYWLPVFFLSYFGNRVATLGLSIAVEKGGKCLTPGTAFVQKSPARCRKKKTLNESGFPRRIKCNHLVSY